MKSNFRHILVGAAVAAWAIAACATEPGGALNQGKVLVLDNGRTLDGDIQQLGEQYRIRRDVGEVWVPATPNMRLFVDWPQAYEFMSRQINLQDPDERLRLARWCHLHGLREQALAEVTAAVKIRPQHAESRQLRAILQRALVMNLSTNLSAKPSLEDLPPSPPPVKDVSSDSVVLFTTKIQPILMNTCVNCHANGRGGNFQLFRSFQGGQQAATQKNLAAVLAQIDMSHPILSPLLIKAVSAHGNAGHPPLKSRHTVPYRILQEWVDNLLKYNPHLQGESLAAGPPNLSSPQVRAVPSFSLPTHMALKGGDETRPVPVKPEEKSASSSAPEPRVLPAIPSSPAPVRPTSPSGVTTSPKQAQAKAGIPLAGPVGSADKTPLSDQKKINSVPASPPRPAPDPIPTTSFAEAGTTPSSTPALEPADPFDPLIFNQQMRPAKKE